MALSTFSIYDSRPARLRRLLDKEPEDPWYVRLARALRLIP